MTVKTKTIFLCLLLGSVSMVGNAGTLSSTVDRNQMNLNETLTLTINYDAQVDSSSIDLSVLSSDFEVLRANPQSSNTVSIVNGKSTRLANTTWTVLLAAKKTGSLTIPSFAIDKDRSKPISIDVSDSKQTKSADQPLQVWVSANQDAVYPLQQIIVEVEISAQANVADLNGPQLIVSNAEVESLGQRNFQRIENGVARQIVTLRYAVSAKQAGELTIPVMTYTGILGGRRSVFGSTGSQVVARSTQLTLKVNEVPKSDTPPFDSAPWFPAEAVTIESAWSGDKNTITVGEPITRTITIRARGQRANVIPPLERPSQSNAYKSYREQAQLDTKVDSDGFISSRVESEAIVVSATGELVLPALETRWWNVEKRQWQLATFPSETIQVIASSNPSPETVLNSSAGATVDSTLSESTSLSSGDGSATIWQLLTALLALVCVVQSWFLLRKNRASRQSGNKSLETGLAQSEHNAWRQLKSALDKGDANVIRETLLAWARAAFPHEQAVSLRKLVSRASNTEFGIEIDKLESELYKSGLGNKSGFNSKRLLELITQLRQQVLEGSSTKPVSAVLPPLYPQ